MFVGAILAAVQASYGLSELENLKAKADGERTSLERAIAEQLAQERKKYKPKPQLVSEPCPCCGSHEYVPYQEVMICSYCRVPRRDNEQASIRTQRRWP